jgi:hypothetical protein
VDVTRRPALRVPLQAGDMALEAGLKHPTTPHPDERTRAGCVSRLCACARLWRDTAVATGATPAVALGTCHEDIPLAGLCEHPRCGAAQARRGAGDEHRLAGVEQLRLQVDACTNSSPGRRRSVLTTIGSCTKRRAPGGTYAPGCQAGPRSSVSQWWTHHAWTQRRVRERRLRAPAVCRTPSAWQPAAARRRRPCCAAALPRTAGRARGCGARTSEVRAT